LHGACREAGKGGPPNEGGDTLLGSNAALIQFSSPYLFQTAPLSKFIVR
jgi:hypothetical protein